MPTLTVIAGPNGSGKSTLTRSLEFEGRDRLLDPDTIARGLNPLNPSAAAIAAGRDVLKRTADYLGRGSSLAVETTLSSRGRVDLIRKANPAGMRSTWYLLDWTARNDASHAFGIGRLGEVFSFRMPT